jgi:hypothetical protein
VTAVRRPLTKELIFRLIQKAGTSPEAALPQLWDAAVNADRAGNAQEAHALKDVILVLLIHHKSELERAEQLARELVGFLPDRFHLELLAKVLRLRGSDSEAVEIDYKSTQATDMHDSERFRKLREDVARRLQQR